MDIDLRSDELSKEDVYRGLMLHVSTPDIWKALGLPSNQLYAILQTALDYGFEKIRKERGYQALADKELQTINPAEFQRRARIKQATAASNAQADRTFDERKQQIVKTAAFTMADYQQSIMCSMKFVIDGVETELGDLTKHTIDAIVGEMQPRVESDYKKLVFLQKVSEAMPVKGEVKVKESLTPNLVDGLHSMTMAKRLSLK